MRGNSIQKNKDLFYMRSTLKNGAPLEWSGNLIVTGLKQRGLGDSTAWDIKSWNSMKPGNFKQSR